LLFVEDRIKKGRTKDQVARELGWAASNDEKELKKGRKKVTQWEHLLALVREVREMSDPPVPWTYFDDQRQVLVDLEQAYYGLRDREPANAETLKQQRMLAILVDSDYEVVRKIRDEDPATYLVPALQEEDRLGDATEGLITSEQDDEETPEGLDELGDEGEAGPEPKVDLKRLIQAVAASHTQDEVELTNGNGTVKVTGETLQDAVKAAVADAAELADQDSKAEDALEAPKKLAKDAVGKVRRALEAYKKVKDHGDFDSSEFDGSVKQLEDQIEALRREIDGS
jgi:hypothetical protein